MDGSKVRLNFSLSWSEWGSEKKATLQSLASKIKLEGFRPGKVPPAVAEKELGSETVLMETAERAIKKFYARALKERDLPAIGSPRVKLSRAPQEGENLEFTVEVAVLPKVSLPENWRGKVKEAGRKALADFQETVDEQKVTEAIEKLAESRAEIKEVERPAREGDVVTIDFLVSREGVPVEGGRGKDQPLLLGSGAFIPGFEKAIEGMKKGESKKIKLSFPEKYHAKHLAGEEAEFEITVKKISERVIATIDDEFARSLGEKFTDLGVLRESVREGLEKELTEKKRDLVGRAVSEAVRELPEMEIPDVLSEAELSAMKEALHRQVAASGGDWQTLISEAGGEEELSRQWRPEAIGRVKLGLILDHLAEKLELEPSNEEVGKHINAALAEYTRPVGEEKEPDIQTLYAQTKDKLRQEKAYEYLVDLVLKEESLKEES